MFEEFQFICGKEDSRQSASRNSNAEIRDWKNMTYKGLTLQIGARHLSRDEIEYTIDRLTLGLTDEQRQSIESIVLQYGICKEIYSLRLDYWEKGGRLETLSFKLPANESIQNFATCKKQWKTLSDKWKKECRGLRKSYIALAYFTMNEAQSLIQSFKSICSFEDGYRDILASKFILPNGDHNGLLKKLGAILTSIWNKSKDNTNVSSEHLKISTLKRGQPNLFISKDNGQLNIVINLFQSLVMLPRAEHVLICKETTTEEE
ncbi:hypothetical protein RFI_38798, partial [Reticulomyxa filosa]